MAPVAEASGTQAAPTAIPVLWALGPAQTQRHQLPSGSCRPSSRAESARARGVEQRQRELTEGDPAQPAPWAPPPALLSPRPPPLVFLVSTVPAALASGKQLPQTQGVL